MTEMVEVCYHYLRKVFSSVNRRLTTGELQNCGISQGLVQWIVGFLRPRQFYLEWEE